MSDSHFRFCQNSRRIWTIDQYTAFINEEGRYSLGDWIHRQQTKNLPKKHRAAVDVLQHCGVAVSELRRQWEDQKTAQMSVRRRMLRQRHLHSTLTDEFH